MICFLEERSFEVVPTEWLTGLNTCQWPPSHVKKRAAARNSVAPAADWTEFKIKILAYKGKND